MRFYVAAVAVAVAVIVIVGMVAAGVWWMREKVARETPPAVVVCYEGVVGMEVPRLVGLYMLGGATICAENWEFHPHFSTNNIAP